MSSRDSEIVEYKERELARREEDLTYRERKATEERRRLEEAKQTTGGLEEAELKKRLEELRAEVGKREKELKAKEEFLRAKKPSAPTRAGDHYRGTRTRGAGAYGGGPTEQGQDRQPSP